MYYNTISVSHDKSQAMKMSLLNPQKVRRVLKIMYQNLYNFSEQMFIPNMYKTVEQLVMTWYQNIKHLNLNWDDFQKEFLLRLDSNAFIAIIHNKASLWSTTILLSTKQGLCIATVFQMCVFIFISSNFNI